MILFCSAAVIGLGGCGETGRVNHKPAAEWALARGGKAVIAGTNREVETVDELPEAPFQLSRIDLNQLEPSVSDKDLRQLPEVDGLTYIGLHSAQVTEKGVDELLKIPSLTEVELSYTQIGDEGLDKLRRLPNLDKLYLYGTRVSDEAVERFRKSRPDCSIFRD